MELANVKIIIMMIVILVGKIAILNVTKVLGVLGY
jgi:hypothetical protein